MLGKPVRTTFVGFKGENVRRIDALDDKDGTLNIAYPVAIESAIWLRVLQLSSVVGQHVTEQSAGPPLQTTQELENHLRNMNRLATIPLPNVTVSVSYTGHDGKSFQQTETIRAIFHATSTPIWVYEDARKEKLFFEGGFGLLGFEDKNNPDDGMFSYAVHEGIVPAH